MDERDNDTCQFCYDRVIFRCTPCKITLCKDCVAVHIKMNSGDSHKIVLFEDIREETTRQLLTRGIVTSGFDSLNDVSYKENGMLYVCSEKYKMIKLLNLSGRNIASFDASKNPLCVTSTSNGVLYTEFGIRAVMFYSKGRIQHLFSTGDWQPQGIITSQTGNILLTLRRKSQAKLVTYRPHGYINSEIQFHNKEQLFSDPWYIVESPRGNICVSDQGRNAVICVSSNGELIFQYSRKGSSFYPRGVCADATSHFVVADPWNNKLHYISACGELICYLQYDAMDSPMSISTVTDKPNCFLICEVSGLIYDIEM